MGLALALSVAAAQARDCGGTCGGAFTHRPPYVEPYDGPGPYWKVRCIKMVNAGGRHAVRAFLYDEHGQWANAPVHVQVNDIVMGVDWKEEWLDGQTERWWDSTIWANGYYWLRVANQNSDIVRDLHTQHGDIAGCGTYGHFLWEVIYDYVAQAPPTPTPTSTPTATSTPTNTPMPLPDADGDGLPDIHEGWPAQPGQGNMYLPDSDGDGLLDGEEDANRNGIRDPGETDPRNADSDGDGYPDGLEVNLYQSNPLDPNSPSIGVDNDGDGLINFMDPNDSNVDVDGDRFTDGYEAAVLDHAAVTNPNRFPSLGDINLDQAITNLDALIAQAVFLNLAHPLDWNAQGADVNRDGNVTNLDALVVQGYFLGIAPHLPLQ